MQQELVRQRNAALVGRDAELDLIASQLAQAQRGQCRFVLLAGEPGIGKTHLLDAVVARAVQDGMLARRGGASDAEGMPPYLPLLEALGAHIRATPPDLLQMQLGDMTPVLATILPELAQRMHPLPPMYTLPPEQARLRLYEAVGMFLATVARPQALVLVFDDLQWADSATLALLSYVARHQADARILIIGAYRAGEAEQNAALQHMLADLNRLRILTTLTIDSLTPSALAMLAAHYLGGPLNPDTSRVLTEQSECNPFFAEELLRDWLETGALAWSGQDWQRATASAPRLPSSIVGAIRQRLERLPPELLDLLQIAAIISRTIDSAILAEVAEHDAEAIEQQLRVAVGLRLLASTNGEQFAFSHDTIRTCLYNDVTMVRRQRLHKRIGEALEARQVPQDAHRLAELSFHFARSGDHVRGVAYAQHAGEAAMHAAAASEAAAYYRSAVDLLVPGDERRGPLLHALGTALLLSNMYAEAIAAFESAQNWFLQQGDVVAAARAAEGQGKAWWQQEAIPQAKVAFELALTLLAERPAPETVGLLVNLSSLTTLSLLQRGAGLDHARHALALAQQLDDPRLIAQASRALGNAQVRAAQLPAGIALLEQARVLAVANDDPVEAAECCAGLRMACCWNAEYQRAIAYGHQEIALAQRCHTPFALRHVYTQLVVLSTVTDGVAAGRHMLDKARELCAGLAAPEAQAYLELTEGMFWGWFQGDYTRGEQLTRAAIESWRRLNPGVLVWYLGIFAMLLARVGKRAEAATSLDELEALVARLPGESMAAGQAMSWLATVSLLLDDRARLLHLYPALSVFRGCLMTGGLIERLLGQIEIVQRDLAKAQRSLAAAEAVARREAHRWELAQVLATQADLALVVGDAGSAERARELLRAAQAQYRYFGNQTEVDNLEQRLQHPDQHAALPGGLSRREAEVLRAVAAGKSNREIGQELTISPRTVENHLVNIYTKIGADNRAAAVAFAIRHGLA